jgi:ABC-type transporter Mla MlaB component
MSTLMTICITKIAESSGKGNLVKVVGRLQADDFAELLRIVQQLSDPVSLDLTELQAIDRPAVTLLRELIGRGVAVRSASPYVKLLLGSESQT